MSWHEPTAHGHAFGGVLIALLVSVVLWVLLIAAAVTVWRWVA